MIFPMRNIIVEKGLKTTLVVRRLKTTLYLPNLPDIRKIHDEQRTETSRAASGARKRAPRRGFILAEASDRSTGHVATEHERPARAEDVADVGHDIERRRSGVAVHRRRVAERRRARLRHRRVP